MLAAASAVERLPDERRVATDPNVPDVALREAVFAAVAQVFGLKVLLAIATGLVMTALL